MENDPFSSLTEQELYELSLCGITSAEQLIKTDVSTVAKELSQAKLYFPDKQFTLNETRLESIFTRYAPIKDAKMADFDSSELRVENVGPTTAFRRSRAERNKKQIRRIKKVHQQILHSTVRTSHPWITFFASLSTLLLIIPAVSVFVLPVMMATDHLPEIPLAFLAFACIFAPTFPYLVLSRLAHCPVCHMRTYTFSDYARNRAAHYIPGLGYNVSTALNIIFRRKYVCPGCGTPIKLTRSKSRKA